MEYSKIVAVTGLPGLYELLNSKTDGAIVRSLDDKTTKFVSSRVHNFSQLESIEVFTKRENVNLVEILKAIDISTEKLPDEKDNVALKNYFGKVYPDLDFERVYSSDLKKMIKWFTVLKNNNIEFKLSEPPPEEEPKPTEAVTKEEIKQVVIPKVELKKEVAPKEEIKKVAVPKVEAKKEVVKKQDKKKEKPATEEKAQAKPKKAAAKKPKEKAEKKDKAVEPKTKKVAPKKKSGK
ncbi:MAG TPA: DUF5606 domain-containing protein [Puia sp.]|jgi:hypothetical protein|nr:DUF5606 domain-containing protein [Puia sp.]